MPSLDRHAEYLRRKARGVLATGRKRKCRLCHAQYYPTYPDQKFCGQKCYLESLRRTPTYCRNCRQQLVGDHWWLRTFCSTTCRREYGIGRNRTVKAQGYVWIRVPDAMPGTDANGRMLEHRWVMQQSIGRPLRPDETVHHINGDRHDNRIENLQVRTGRHGTGVVLACGDCGSHNVVRVPISDPH